MPVTNDIGKVFIKRDVQGLLHKMTGFDLNKIFAPKFNTKMRNPKIELLSQEELETRKNEAIWRAKRLLQMPPVLKAREKCDTTIVEDPKLNLLNLKNTKYMFIDISMDIPDRKRSIVVREANGTLRHASWREREKMLQTYYPINGKSLEIPKMFESENLEERLNEKKYLKILNEACIQFEPDDADFIRVCNRTYEVIDKSQDYEHLKSTRFYGPMVFHLTWFKKLDNLISYHLNHLNINDTIDLVKLFYLLHPESKTASQENDLQTKPLEFLNVFITQELTENLKSELALKTYIDSTKEQETKAQENIANV